MKNLKLILNIYKNINKNFICVWGNHDYGKKSIDGSYSDNFQHQIDYTKYSDKWYLPKDIIRLKNINGITIEFFVLDTNIDAI